jgi:uncharacterized RDD family membrane protein YckC
MDWYYAESGKQIGPIDDTSFQNLVSRGMVRDNTLVWHAGMTSWLPYQNVRPAATPPALDGQAGANVRYCSECGKALPYDEMVAFGNSMVCGACKPLYAQKLLEGVRLPGAVRYGGFWIRVVAIVIDSIVLYVVALVGFGLLTLFRFDWASLVRPTPDITRLLALEGGLGLVNLAAAAVYDTWMVGRYGATLGKLACQMRIVMNDGGKLTYGRALGRHFAKYLSSFTLGIGYIMAGIDEEKRALHDRICDTRVIKN